MQTNIERSFCGFFFTCVFYKNVEGVRRLTPKWYSNARSATFEVRLPLGELYVCVIVTKTLSPLSRLYIDVSYTNVNLFFGPVFVILFLLAAGASQLLQFQLFLVHLIFEAVLIEIFTNTIFLYNFNLLKFV